MMDKSAFERFARFRIRIVKPYSVSSAVMRTVLLVLPDIYFFTILEIHQKVSDLALTVCSKVYFSIVLRYVIMVIRAKMCRPADTHDSDPYEAPLCRTNLWPRAVSCYFILFSNLKFSGDDSILTFFQSSRRISIPTREGSVNSSEHLMADYLRFPPTCAYILKRHQPLWDRNVFLSVLL
jgi:hypothetical protein